MTSTNKGSGIGKIAKALIVNIFRLLAIIIAFMCKIAALILNKISEIFEKLSGNGSGH